MQGPFSPGHIHMLREQGIVSGDTLLLHDRLGAAPLQSALLTATTPSMVPIIDDGYQPDSGGH